MLVMDVAGIDGKSLDKVPAAGRYMLASPPVQLLSFEAQLHMGKVELVWTTFTEQSNAMFTIERSSDGEHFEMVAQVAGSGSISFSKTYWAEDTRPMEGLSYYRLKQTDQDGTYTYFDVVSIRKYAAHLQLLSVSYTKGSLHLEVHDPVGEGLQVQLFNMAGALVAVSSGTDIPLPTGNGVYILRLSNGLEELVEKISLTY